MQEKQIILIDVFSENVAISSIVSTCYSPKSSRNDKLRYSHAYAGQTTLSGVLTPMWQLEKVVV
jgi:hypothetical protein